MERLLLACCLMLPVLGHAQFPNYENSATLERANEMMLKVGRSGGEVKLDEDELVRLYLKYLEEFPETLNAQDVHMRIGMVYLVRSQGKEGSEADRLLAEKHLKKAMEIDPAYISQGTVYARTNSLALFPSGLSRVREGIKVYKWLREVSKEQIAESARKRAEMYRVRTYDADTGETIIEYVKDSPELMEEYRESVSRTQARDAERHTKVLSMATKGAATNLVSFAENSGFPEQALSEIRSELRAYPEIVRLADEASGKLVTSQLAPGDFQDVALTLRARPVRQGDAALSSATAPRAQGTLAPAGVLAEESSPSRGAKWRFIASCVLVLLLGCGALLLAGRRGRRAT